jgi:predicted MPP superfamily phosphohydrolase
MGTITRYHGAMAARPPRVLAFLATAMAIVGAGHYYIAARLVLAPSLDGAAEIVGLGVVGLLWSLLPVWGFARGRGKRGVGWRWLSVAATAWLGVAFVLVTILAATDLLLWGLSLLGGLPHDQGVEDLRALATLALTGMYTTAAVGNALRVPRVKRVEVELPRWPAALDGFRIAQLSDVHIGPLLRRDFAAAVTRCTNDLEADLVVITGDLVDGSVEQVGEEVRPFGELRGRHGVYFITGNHDHYQGADSWVRFLRGLGIRSLRNEHRVLAEDSAPFVLAGVDDHDEDIEGALAGADEQYARILLAHHPQTFPEASRNGVDLQLSGHTHGGQLWPFSLLVRLSTRYVSGLHFRPRSALYVSNGTGFWGPPMRLGAPSEITEIVLRSA